MQIQGFTKMSVKEKEETYGGWAWLIAMIPMLVQTVITATASFKSIFSEKGTIKGKDVAATWDNTHGASSTKAGKQQQIHVSYYAY